MKEISHVPPHSLDAEAAVLSAIMLDNRVLPEVLDIIQPASMYSEAHRQILEAARMLNSQGKPADIVTVGTLLNEVGRIAQIGGMSYLTEILNCAPAISSAAKYAEDIAKFHRAREVQKTCSKTSAKLYIRDEPIETILEDHERAIHEIALSRNAGSDLEAMGPILKAALKEDLEAATDGRKFRGYDTGYVELNETLGGLHPGDLTIIAGRPGMAKALPMDARVLTPTGWRFMGSLSMGDLVIGNDGKPYPIIGISDQGEKEVFRVTLDEGSSVEACDDHLWFTNNRHQRRYKKPGSVKSTREIRESLQRCDSGGLNHSIPYMSPAEFEPICPLPIHPYLMGVFLGDGCGRNSTIGIDNPEIDIRDRIMKLLPDGDTLSHDDDGLHMRVKRLVRTTKPSHMKIMLGELGLLGCYSWQKFIPEIYLRASVEDRILLLQGLCDTDGYVTSPGAKAAEFATSSPQLVHCVSFLVGSLGGRVTVAERMAHYTLPDGTRKVTRPAFKMQVSFPKGNIVPVSSEKHLKKWKQGKIRVAERFIKTVEPSGRKECRCIAIDSPDHLYVTEGFIVTHNTSLLLNMAVNMADSDRCPNSAVAFYSLEMPKKQLARRALSSRSGIDLQLFRTTLPEKAIPRLVQASQYVNKLPIYITDQASLSIQDIRASVRKKQAELHRQGKKLVLVGIDYLQLMRLPDAGSQVQSFEELTKMLKISAKEFECPFVVLSQLNRAVEQRDDKRPMLSDLRSSGSIEQDADNVLMLYRDEYYNKNSDAKGMAEIIVAKQRNGPPGMIEMRFDAKTTTFRGMNEVYEPYAY